MFILRKSILILVCGLTVVLTLGRISAQEPTEHQVKAAMLYNFARFTEWPASAFPKPASPLIFCLIQDGLIRSALEKTIGSKKIQDREIQIRLLSKPSRLEECHLLFVGAGDEGDFLSWKGALRSLPILTVGETDKFLREGGLIRFYLADNKVRFEISKEASQQSGVQLSSKLLSLGGGR